MPGTGYVIKTKDGDKGPFSTEQIGELVEQGKIPPTLKIGDVDAATVVTAQDVIARSATADDQRHDETEASLPPVEERPAPPPTPRGASGRRPRATTRRNRGGTAAGAGSGGRAGASGTRRTRRRKKSSNVPLFIGLGVGLVVLIGVVGFLAFAGDSRPYLGAWRVDVEARLAEYEKESGEPLTDELRERLAQAITGMRLTFDEDGTGSSTSPDVGTVTFTYAVTEKPGGFYVIFFDDRTFEEQRDAEGRATLRPSLVDKITVSFDDGRMLLGDEETEHPLIFLRD